MSEEIKAEHRLVELSEGIPDSWKSYSWKCSCGAGVSDYYLSREAARDAHAEHAQESGEYGLPGGFEVVESLHGETCAGCRDAARSAAIHARATGSVGATYQVNEPSDPWEDPEVAHSARVARPTAGV